MSQQQRRPSQRAVYPMPLLRSLSLMGSLGLLGSSLVALPTAAQAQSEASTPTVQPQSDQVPVTTSAEALLQPQSAPESAAEAEVSPPSSETAPASDSGTSNSNSSPTGYRGDLIDPTDYSVGATQSPDSPTLIFTDRATGCRMTLSQGQSAPTRNCRAGAQTSDEAGQEVQGSGEQQGFSAGPVTLDQNGLSVGNTTVISREYFNEKVRPLNLLRRGVQEFVFPLSVPAPITSLFGWREHPIFGERRFHSGTDLGAPAGTPVLAAKAGQVTTADYLSGYGLTVILRHDEGSQETRYAHLSRILVRPGDWIEQGDVVGLVGSTGNSTGPHLHFELRQLTAQGWILVDPNDLMQYTVANLMDTLNQPLQALGALTGLDNGAGDSGAGAEETGNELMQFPYRPAQPNAS